MTVRFISDPHIRHENMAIKRGFPDSYHHDENFTMQWNLIVHKRDVTYILGDLTMEKNNYSFLDRLNGTIHIVGGNHDKIGHSKYILEYVNGFAGMVKYRSKQYGKFWLTHCPIHPMELDIDKAKGFTSYNIHGHIHDAYKIPDKRYINVSAEVIDYKPKTLKELIDE
jgi:calcineurin-like phosphoesterase family protein